MGVSTVDLYRNGNANSARLDHVRIDGPTRDVDTYIQNGTVWVSANGKGVSSESSPDPNWNGKLWRFDGGLSFPDSLRLFQDDPGHWVWEPAHDMPLARYRDALATANSSFVKV
jgi:hypothetical protein